MVSHQPRISFNQVTDSSAAEDCLQLSCPNLLTRASTGISLQDEAAETHVQDSARISVESRSQQASNVESVERSAQSTVRQSLAQIRNLFVGPSYWEKLASSQVYPKHINWLMTEEKLTKNTLKEQEDNASDQSQESEFLQNLKLQYDSDEEWFDTDCSEFQKCLSD